MRKRRWEGGKGTVVVNKKAQERSNVGCSSQMLVTERAHHRLAVCLPPGVCMYAGTAASSCSMPRHACVFSSQNLSQMQKCQNVWKRKKPKRKIKTELGIGRVFSFQRPACSALSFLFLVVEVGKAQEGQGRHTQAR